MTRPRLWAPGARRVELETGGRRHAMRALEGGWHEADLDLLPGTDYRFWADGPPALPDPRSGWQPEGVHGPSRTVDHGAFAWQDRAWTGFPLSAAVIYELHVGTFTPAGTFEGAVERLDHVAALGANAVELMPVAEFPGERGWGYDGVDLYAPHHAYGGPEGLKCLVDACHARGLAVVLDVVYNHLGRDGNHLERFGPYFSDRHTTPWGRAVNFDGPGSRGVRDFVLENALGWLRDHHLDGVRLDAVHAIHDASAVHLLEELSGRVRELEAHLGRQLWVIAESDLNDPRVVTPREAGGLGCDAQWSDDFHHALHALLTGERTGYYGDFGTMEDLATALRQAYVYDGRASASRGRSHGRPPRGLSGHRFLAYTQNHDQVGNRALGERSSALMSQGRLRVAAALLCASPFVPMLFQGEEWGASTPFLYFTDHRAPALARAVRRGRAGEVAAAGARGRVPDPQARTTFERSRLDWEEPAREPHRGLLEWHRRLLALRRELPELADGALDRVGVRYDERARWLVLERGRVTVACNLGPREARPQVSADAVLAESCEGVRLRAARAVLPPDSVGVFGS